MFCKTFDFLKSNFGNVVGADLGEICKLFLQNLYKSLQNGYTLTGISHTLSHTLLNPLPTNLPQRSPTNLPNHHFQPLFPPTVSPLFMHLSQQSSHTPA
jgi:hypothetical protein